MDKRKQFHTFNRSRWVADAIQRALENRRKYGREFSLESIAFNLDVDVEVVRAVYYEMCGF